MPFWKVSESFRIRIYVAFCSSDIPGLPWKSEKGHRMIELPETVVISDQIHATLWPLS